MPDASTSATCPSAASTEVDTENMPPVSSSGAPSTTTPGKRHAPSSASSHCPDFCALNSWLVSLRTDGAKARGFRLSSVRTLRPEFSGAEKTTDFTFTSEAIRSAKGSRAAKCSETTCREASGWRTRS